jgi:Fe-S cluster assembly iron-binding protein IscA
MLSITRHAAKLVRTLTKRSNGSPDAGLRIRVDPLHDSLSMGIADAPAPADLVVTRDEARVFLSPKAAHRLGDRTMGAEITEDRSRFFLDS